MIPTSPFRERPLRRQRVPMLQPVEMRMILVAGADVTSMREASLHLFRAGHMPVMGEGFSAPLAPASGPDHDEAFAAVDRPASERRLGRSDAVLPLRGPPASD